jgi:transcriptional regulator with XRE-family HTH domain/KaiC/GvpD/RAD55 family RecA-like ATPase
MTAERIQVGSGVRQLDRLLGGLYIGDNVVWYDDAGSLAFVFCLNFIQASRYQDKPIIYVSFDKSPKNLLETLGELAENPLLTILDCFTYGKGAGSEVFLKFYNDKIRSGSCRVVLVKEPRSVSKTMDSFYGVHETLEGDVRFVFESLTGMQELWSGEEDVLNFYSHSCPRLYELNTIAYWIIEKQAHSRKLRAQINQIAQVAIDLSLKRGKTSLTILKAEKRNIETSNIPFTYWNNDLNVVFETERKNLGRLNLGMRLKELRNKRGFSQTELAKHVGVTPSSISQIESNLIYPSIPALLKMAEVLSVDISSFFHESQNISGRIIFPFSEASDIQLPGIAKKNIRSKLLIPVDLEPKAEPYLIEIPPGETLLSHFFIHKGDEIGYMLSGELQLKINKAVYSAVSGDTIYLSSEIPSQWKNPGPDTAKILWVKVR